MGKRATTHSANRWVVVLIVGIIALFIMAVSYVFYNNEKYTTVTPSNELTVREDNEAVLSAYQKDSDGDGLADWEELLWDMDPNNPDTDGDGIGDKKDVLNERTALVDPKEIETGMNLEPSTPKNNKMKNATEVLAHEFFGNYMYTLKEDGATLSEEREQEIITDALEAVSPVMQPPRYTKNDVHTVPVTTQNRITYIEAVRDNLRNMVDGVTSEHEAIYAIGQSRIKWAVEELTKTIEQYNHYLDKLKNMSVPSDATTIHADVVQALFFYIYVLEGFTLIEEDPLRTAASSRIFLNAEQSLKNTYVAMREYMDSHHPLQNTSPEENQQ